MLEIAGGIILAVIILSAIPFLSALLIIYWKYILIGALSGFLCVTALIWLGFFNEKPIIATLVSIGWIFLGPIIYSEHIRIREKDSIEKDV